MGLQVFIEAACEDEGPMQSSLRPNIPVDGDKFQTPFPMTCWSCQEVNALRSVRDENALVPTSACKIVFIQVISSCAIPQSIAVVL